MLKRIDLLMAKGGIRLAPEPYTGECIVCGVTFNTRQSHQNHLQSKEHQCNAEADRLLNRKEVKLFNDE